jgi:hypothetical protein
MLHDKKNTQWSQVPVAHACNPSYSRGRDQEARTQSLPEQVVCEIRAKVIADFFAEIDKLKVKFTGKFKGPQ